MGRDDGGLCRETVEREAEGIDCLGAGLDGTFASVGARMSVDIVEVGGKLASLDAKVRGDIIETGVNLVLVPGDGSPSGLDAKRLTMDSIKWSEPSATL